MTMYRLYSESASSDGTQYVWELTWRPVRSGESPVVRRISQTERNAIETEINTAMGDPGRLWTLDDIEALLGPRLKLT